MPTARVMRLRRECVRASSSLRMPLRDLFRHKRVVPGDLMQVGMIAEQINAAVADLRNVSPFAADDQRRNGGAHPGEFQVAVGLFKNDLVGGMDSLAQGVGSGNTRLFIVGAHQCLQGDPAGTLPSEGTPHPIGNGKKEAVFLRATQRTRAHKKCTNPRCSCVSCPHGRPGWPR